MIGASRTGNYSGGGSSNAEDLDGSIAQLSRVQREILQKIRQKQNDADDVVDESIDEGFSLSANPRVKKKLLGGRHGQSAIVSSAKAAFIGKGSLEAKTARNADVLGPGHLSSKYAAPTESLRSDNMEGSQMDHTDILRAQNATGLGGAGLATAAIHTGPDALVQPNSDDVFKIIQELNRKKRGDPQTRNEEAKDDDRMNTKDVLDEARSQPSAFEDPLDIPVNVLMGQGLAPPAKSHRILHQKAQGLPSSVTDAPDYQDPSYDKEPSPCKDESLKQPHRDPSR